MIWAYLMCVCESVISYRWRSLVEAPVAGPSTWLMGNFKWFGRQSTINVRRITSFNLSSSPLAIRRTLNICLNEMFVFPAPIGKCFNFELIDNSWSDIGRCRIKLNGSSTGYSWYANKPPKNDQWDNATKCHIKKCEKVLTCFWCHPRMLHSCTTRQHWSGGTGRKDAKRWKNGKYTLR